LSCIIITQIFYKAMRRKMRISQRRKITRMMRLVTRRRRRRRASPAHANGGEGGEGKVAAVVIVVMTAAAAVATAARAKIGAGVGGRATRSGEVGDRERRDRTRDTRDQHGLRWPEFVQCHSPNGWWHSSRSMIAVQDQLCELRSVKVRSGAGGAAVHDGAVQLGGGALLVARLPRPVDSRD
jgi:hypothetical protein